MEKALIDILLANPAVEGRVGRRVWPGRAPQDNQSYPYVTIRMAGSVHDYTMTAPSGYVSSRIQVDVYGTTWTDCKLTARSIIAALSGFKGVQGSITIQGVFIDAERDLPTADEDDDVNNLFRTSIDLMIHHG